MYMKINFNIFWNLSLNLNIIILKVEPFGSESKTKREKTFFTREMKYFNVYSVDVWSILFQTKWVS